MFEKEKTDWDKVAKSTNSEDLYAFMKKYPSGAVYELAQFRLDQVQRPALRISVPPDGVQVLPSGVNRYEVGDVHTYERRDLLTNERRPIALTVTYADKDRVELNHGQAVRDQMGGVPRNRFGEKSPASMSAPADIAIGKRWRSAFINTMPDGKVSSNYWDNHVAALEDIEVPAGTFRVYRIDGQGWARFADGTATRMTGTTWVDPRMMVVVRVDLKFTRDGKVMENSSDRLVRLQQVPRR